MSLLSLNKSYTKTPDSDQSYGYDDEGDVQLTDGLIDQQSYLDCACTDVGWYQQTTITVRIDLESVYSIESVKFRSGRDDSVGIYTPAECVVSGSLNDSDWTELGSYGAVSQADHVCATHELAGLSGSYRYIKFVWTNNAGNKWLMLSELEVYGSSTVNVTVTPSVLTLTSSILTPIINPISIIVTPSVLTLSSSILAPTFVTFGIKDLTAEQLTEGENEAKIQIKFKVKSPTTPITINSIQYDLNLGDGWQNITTYSPSEFVVVPDSWTECTLLWTAKTDLPAGDYTTKIRLKVEN